MSWPELEGYSEENRAAFNHLEESHRLIFFSFEPRLISRDMSGRYDLVYRKLLSPVPADGPAGLTVYRFDDASGFENEQLYVGVRPGSRRLLHAVLRKRPRLMRWRPASVTCI